MTKQTTETAATISYLQGCVDSKDDELYRVKGVRNELQDKCDALLAENAKLREALARVTDALALYQDKFGVIAGGTESLSAFQQARAALAVKS